MTAEVQTFFDPETFTATHVVWDCASNEAMIIDSVLDFDAKSGRTDTKSADQIIAFVAERNLSVQWIAETHIHADHLTAAPYLQEKLGGKIAVGSQIGTVQKVFKDVYNAGDDFQTDGQQFDHQFDDGDTFSLGDETVTVWHTPGHTPACATYLIRDMAFVGDTLFMPDFGTARCDFPGGDPKRLYQSIQRILSLPDDTRLFMCHDYAPGGRDFFWVTTVAEERAKNIHVKDGIAEDAFVDMRADRDKTLSMPALMLPSVQINMRAGHMPPADENGTHYLKIPIDTL